MELCRFNAPQSEKLFRLPRKSFVSYVKLGRTEKYYQRLK